MSPTAKCYTIPAADTPAATCWHSSDGSIDVPDGLDVQFVLDIITAHESRPVKNRLVGPNRARWHLLFTPVSASWLKLTEGWFSALTPNALTDNSFLSVRELAHTIDLRASHRNDNPQPFIWTKTVDGTITKVQTRTSRPY